MNRGFSTEKPIEKRFHTGSRIYLYTVKTKITVSVKREVVDNAKLALLKEKRTLSDYIEDSLRSLSVTEFLNDICKELNLDFRYISNEDVERMRPDMTGKIYSENILREMRNERNSRLS